MVLAVCASTLWGEQWLFGQKNDACTSPYNDAQMNMRPPRTPDTPFRNASSLCRPLLFSSCLVFFIQHLYYHLKLIPRRVNATENPANCSIFTSTYSTRDSFQIRPLPSPSQNGSCLLLSSASLPSDHSRPRTVLLSVQGATTMHRAGKTRARIAYKDKVWSFKDRDLPFSLIDAGRTRSACVPLLTSSASIYRRHESSCLRIIIPVWGYEHPVTATSEQR